MKFKVGDKVRVKDLKKISISTPPGINTYMYQFSGKEAVITDVKGNLYYINIDMDKWLWSDEMLDDIDDHITTKEFLKEMEKFGFEIERNKYTYTYARKNGKTLYLDEEKINNFNSQHILLTNEELDLVVRYVKTPIEFREVKEYSLQCPLTKYYYMMSKKGNLVHINEKSTLSKYDGPGKIPTFTQQEIDQLGHEDFIKQLIKEEVK